MKKISILLIIICIILCGCAKEKKNEPIKIKGEVEKDTNSYHDDNNTPICFYELKNNKLKKLSTINKTLNNLEDIGLFQIYPSCEEEINLNNSFADSFKELWDKYNKDNNLKIGYSLSFKTKEENTIFFNILSPNNTMEKWEYIMTYLYDDYANKYKDYYSHLENSDYNENSLLTAIKLQSGYKYNEIIEKIECKVFTYDTEDDFLDSIYRGNSSSTLSIIIN